MVVGPPLEEVPVKTANHPQELDKREAAVRQALCDLWEEAHGIPARRACIQVRPDHILVRLMGILSPAERASILEDQGQQMIQQYAGRLLALIQPDMLVQVQKITGRQVLSSCVQVEVNFDQLLCQFVLGAQIPSREPAPRPAEERKTSA